MDSQSIELPLSYHSTTSGSRRRAKMELHAGIRCRALVAPSEFSHHHHARVDRSYVECWLDVELPNVQNPRVSMCSGEPGRGELVDGELQSANDTTMRCAWPSIVFACSDLFPRQLLVCVGEASLRKASSLQTANWTRCHRRRVTRRETISWQFWRNCPTRQKGPDDSPADRRPRRRPAGHAMAELLIRSQLPTLAAEGSADPTPASPHSGTALWSASPIARSSNWKIWSSVRLTLHTSSNSRPNLRQRGWQV